MTTIRKMFTAVCIAFTVFVGSISPMSAQVPGGGKECDTEMVIDDVIYTDYGIIIIYHFEETCVTILD